MGARRLSHPGYGDAWDEGFGFAGAFAKAGITLPVIIITAYHDVQTYNRAMQAGIVAYLRKPFDDQELLEALRQAATQRHRGAL